MPITNIKSDPKTLALTMGMTDGMETSYARLEAEILATAQYSGDLRRLPGGLLGQV